MPPVRFEPTISVGERPQTDALDRAVTGTGCVWLYQVSVTYGTRAKRGTRNDFQWHAEWIEIQ
jgi:hypothetical protein